MLKIHTQAVKILSDLTTPVSLYLKLREYFPEVLLLESSDYSSKEDSKSFICADSLMTLSKDENRITTKNHVRNTIANNDDMSSVDAVSQFIESIKFITGSDIFKYNGIFGYTSFDNVQEFESLPFRKDKENYHIPLLRYDFFRYIIVFDHFYETLTIVENRPVDEPSGLQNIMSIISRQDHQTFSFNLKNTEQSNMPDTYYMDIVERARQHCQRGDVFQMVLSRRFYQEFSGDEFNVYRALRSVNPSPYLFYFDYGSYKIFGSSPEAQMVVADGMAEIHPIAGTFRRTGNFSEDQQLAQKLLQDPKENAEHIMLVDLARNDLSKNCIAVKVEKYREVQFFSHVIHLVSIVKGKIKNGISAYQIFADTFPAGTLSGAPKHKALQLIDAYEPTARGFYGGGIGMIGLDGSLNHAIIIRSFLCKDKKLYYQAGAGIVIDSVPESELQEVKNKLAALHRAMEMAEKLG